LGSIAAGRPAFGFVLVVTFGVGMAAVMTGVGLAMIVARTRLDRMPSRSSLCRLATAAPLLGSVAVLGLGLVLTWQAVAGRPVLGPAAPDRAFARDRLVPRRCYA